MKFLPGHSEPGNFDAGFRGWRVGLPARETDPRKTGSNFLR